MGSLEARDLRLEVVGVRWKQTAFYKETFSVIGIRREKHFKEFSQNEIVIFYGF